MTPENTYRKLLSDRIDPALGLSVLDQVSGIVQSVDRSLYEAYEKVARERVLPRDPEDWHIVSTGFPF